VRFRRPTVHPAIGADTTSTRAA